MSGLKKLIGKHISAIYQDSCNIVFKFGNGEILSMYAYAECCSDTWIETVEIIPGAVGATVTEIKEETFVATDDPIHDCLKSYQTRIRTLSGDIVIEYRNASNGYYGGELEEGLAVPNPLPPLIAYLNPERLLKEII